MDWYLAVLKKYAVFEGRARRKEYWMFSLINMIIVFIMSFIQQLFLLSESSFILFGAILIGFVVSVYGLAIFIPFLAVTVRRLHDVGKSGWFYLLVLIPIIGWIWILVLLCTDSQPGTNQYGPNPKQNEYISAESNSVSPPYPLQPGQSPVPAVGAITPNTDFKFCPQCGAKNKISSTFCNQCGYKIPGPQASAPNPDDASLTAMPPIDSEIAAASEQMNEPLEPMPEPIVSTPEANLKFCPQCGAGNKISNAFCNQCGHKMPVPQAAADQVAGSESRDVPQGIEVEQRTEAALQQESHIEEIEDATQLLQKPIVPVLRIQGNGPAEPVAIDKPEFVIGRNADATDYTIENNTNVGRTHAKIVNPEGVYYLVDLESKNGTFINDVQIESGVPTAINFGDVIKLANQEFIFEQE